MESVKMAMNNLCHRVQIDKDRNGVAILQNNFCIIGPTGCGKTTAAYAVAKVLCKNGCTTGEKEEPISTTFEMLVGDSEDKIDDNIQKLLEDAKETSILIENMHEFITSENESVGSAVIDGLVKAYHAASGRIPFIITVDSEKVKELFTKKPKLQKLFDDEGIIEIDKYSVDEYTEIAEKIASETMGLVFSEDVKEILKYKIGKEIRKSSFKETYTIRDMLKNAYSKMVKRLHENGEYNINDTRVLTNDDLKVEENEETVEEILEDLRNRTGMEGIKKQIEEIVAEVEVEKMCGTLSKKNRHLLFLGNPGTGKTTVARDLGRLYKAMDILPDGKLKECTRTDLVADYVGGTAVKVQNVVEEAMGGILFIDEAYSLWQGEGDTYGKEAIETLMKYIEDYRDSFMVIMAGYTDKMKKFMEVNPGLPSRFPTSIYFDDYSTEDLVNIFKENVAAEGLLLDVDAKDYVFEFIEHESKGENFGNARGVRNIFERVISNRNMRLAKIPKEERTDRDYKIIRKEDLFYKDKCDGEEQQTRDYLYELSSMVGIASVKKDVKQMIDAVKYKKELQSIGQASAGYGNLNMVFKGNPGTGKTTVAEIIGGIYNQLGVLSTGKVVPCTREDLVAGYTGQTAIKTSEKIDAAKGGILFIDEAYRLVGDDYGKEALDTLLKVENFRGDIMVILAGYEEPMDALLKTNPGLRSRFPKEIMFEDYTISELVSIFKNIVKSNNLHLEDSCDELLYKIFQKRSSQEDFGNARGARNLFEEMQRERVGSVVALVEKIENERPLAKEEKAKILLTVKKEHLKVLLK